MPLAIGDPVKLDNMRQVKQWLHDNDYSESPVRGQYYHNSDPRLVAIVSKLPASGRLSITEYKNF